MVSNPLHWPQIREAKKEWMVTARSLKLMESERHMFGDKDPFHSLGPSALDPTP